MAAVENVATAALTVVALALTLVAARAWWHSRSTRVLLLTIGFGLLLVKALTLSVGLFRRAAWTDDLLLPLVLLDLGALGVFYAAILQRTGT